MNDQLKRWVEGFVKNPGAESPIISQTAALIDSALPSDYFELLKHMNGGEGFVGNEYVRLYPVEKILLLNQAYGVEDFVPGLLIFGSNGSGEAFAFDTRGRLVSIVRIPFIPMDLKYSTPCGETLTQFFTFLAQQSPNANPLPGLLPNPETIGKEVHEITPVVFGGDPNDPNNKALLTPEEYAPYVVWWNRKYREMTGE